MAVMVYLGAAISLLGIGGLVWCILRARAAKREGLADAAMRARLQGLVAVNLAALMCSALGLGMIAAALILGA